MPSPIPMPGPLVITNDGPRIVATNFWELPECALGKYLISVNAGAFRLLLPEVLEECLTDMGTALGVAISRGPWPAGGLADAFELLFDDGSANPFTLHTSAAAFDRVPTAADASGDWALTVWTRPRHGVPHQALARPCRYRRARQLPDLRPWTER